MKPHDTRNMGRREFLAAAGTANLMILSPQTALGSAANSAVRLGLVGCGGRGTHVSTSFAKHAKAHVTALADLYPDQLDKAKQHFDGVSKEHGYSPIDRSQMFVGANAYKELVSSNQIDAVYVATPVYFHPEHFEVAVDAGKHVYLEKPVGLDVPGVKRVLRAAEKAKGRQSVTVGLQLRHATPYVELVKRLHGGQIGEIVSGLVHYYAGALERPERPGAAALDLRVRNWMWDKALSGDIVVEQNVHVLDVTNWALKGHPVEAWGRSGRRGRTDSGDCNSHYDCVLVYPKDVHISFASTQFIKGSWNVEMQYFGQKGNAQANYGTPVQITGDEPWEFPGLGENTEQLDTKAAMTGAFKGALDDADPNKQKAFVESISSGKFLNEIDFGAESTLSAILARTAAETGRAVGWDEILRSEEVWDSKVDWSKFA